MMGALVHRETGLLHRPTDPGPLAPQLSASLSLFLPPNLYAFNGT